jgi:hypothetical protein
MRVWMKTQLKEVETDSCNSTAVYIKIFRGKDLRCPYFKNKLKSWDTCEENIKKILSQSCHYE